LHRLTLKFTQRFKVQGSRFKVQRFRVITV
jgi:hypothetical protein